jgi:hypothetical protein
MTLSLEIRPSDSISEKLLTDFISLAEQAGKTPEAMLAEVIATEVSKSQPSVQ